MSTSAPSPSAPSFWRSEIFPVALVVVAGWAAFMGAFYYLTREGQEQADLIGLAIGSLSGLIIMVHAIVSVALQYGRDQNLEAANQLERELKKALAIKSYVDSAEAAINRTYNELKDANEPRRLELYRRIRDGLATIENQLVREYPECGRLSDQALRIVGFPPLEGLARQIAQVDEQIARSKPMVG